MPSIWAIQTRPTVTDFAGSVRPGGLFSAAITGGRPTRRRRSEVPIRSGCVSYTGGVLVTARLALVPIADAHVRLLVELDSDPAVKRFIDGGKPSTVLEAEEFVASSIGHRSMAFTADERVFVGWFGLVPGPADQRELGYRIGPAHWNRGFATEGARALRDHAFETLDVSRLWAQTMTVNLASRRVLEKVGFRLVRQFFQEWPDLIEGSEHGDVEYELWARRPDNASRT